MNDGTCPEEYSYFAGHKRLGKYVQPHCRKAHKRYYEGVAGLGMRTNVEGWI
ncbi:hypothetical protein Thermo_00756 [Thermoplasmatales archaeon]|nr:hypothetical protein Thermo_00756 [Thermoplasmatales archaeon]